MGMHISDSMKCETSLLANYKLHDYQRGDRTNSCINAFHGKVRVNYKFDM